MPNFGNKHEVFQKFPRTDLKNKPYELSINLKFLVLGKKTIVTKFNSINLFTKKQINRVIMKKS